MYVDVQYKNYKRTFLSTSKIDSTEKIDGKKNGRVKMLRSIIVLKHSLYQIMFANQNRLKHSQLVVHVWWHTSTSNMEDKLRQHARCLC